ncbi:MAG TPA: hypothetical protein VFV49_07300 [Thermoanaerobaculia bacterium]|nr:hypothetical protein [Thermoanaerobaculia bacterium]
MRTWSIKTVVATLSLTVILAAVAPRAEAKSSQPNRTQAGATQRFQRVVNRLLARFLGIKSESIEIHLPADPVPMGLNGTETETDTTTATPKKQW